MNMIFFEGYEEGLVVDRTGGNDECVVFPERGLGVGLCKDT